MVGRYAELMTLGEWRFTGQGVTVAQTGTLIDGQHRLHAVVQSGVSVMMMLMTGEDEANFSAYDGGAVRTAGDRLRRPTGLVAAAMFAIAAGHDLYRPPLCVTEEVAARMEEGFGQVFAAVPDRAFIVAGAAVRVAVCILLDEMPNMAGDIIRAYAATGVRDYNNMPALTQALVRQIDARAIVRNTTQADKLDACGRALKAFDPRIWQSTARLVGLDTATVRARVRAYLARGGVL